MRTPDRASQSMVTPDPFPVDGEGAINHVNSV